MQPLPLLTLNSSDDMPLNITAPGTYNLTTSDRSITIAGGATTASIVLLAAASNPPQVNIAFAPGTTVPVVTITSAGGSIGQLAGGLGASFVMNGSTCTELTLQSDGTNHLISGSKTASGGAVQISKTTGISALTLGALTTLYTVPAGRSLVVTNLVIKTNTVVGTVTTNPVLSIGSNASTYDNLMASTAMVGVVSAARVFNFPILGATPIFAAGATIVSQIDTAQVGATALTYDVELYGVLS
jgi:hypothetical protein